MQDRHDVPQQPVAGCHPAEGEPLAAAGGLAGEQFPTATGQGLRAYRAHSRGTHLGVCVGDALSIEICRCSTSVPVAEQEVGGGDVVVTGPLRSTVVNAEDVARWKS